MARCGPLHVGVLRAGARLRTVLICRARVARSLFSTCVKRLLKVLDADGFAGRILLSAGFGGLIPAGGSFLGRWALFIRYVAGSPEDDLGGFCKVAKSLEGRLGGMDSLGRRCKWTMLSPPVPIS